MSVINTLPSFILAGASLSGAEVLHNLLQGNQALFFPKGKPSSFFYRNDLYARGITPYQTLFQSCDVHKVAGDLGVHYFERGIVLNAEKKYLWQPPEDSALRLKKHCPNAKIILSLRHPLQRAFLQFQQAQQTKIEKAPDFSSALKEELEGQRTPEHHPLCYLYRNLYSEHVAHWKRLFGASNLYTCVYENWRMNIEQELHSIERFIGVRPHTPDALETAKSQGLVTNKASPVLEFLGKFPSLEPLQKFYLARTKKQASPEKSAAPFYPALDSTVEAPVKTMISSDIAKLQNLIGRSDLGVLWPL